MPNTLLSVHFKFRDLPWNVLPIVTHESAGWFDLDRCINLSILARHIAANALLERGVGLGPSYQMDLMLQKLKHLVRMTDMNNMV